MQNLLEQLKKVLAKDERLVSEGELLKNKVIELGIKLDAGLLKLLLADKQMKKAFFEKVGEATIFDKDKFVRFVSNKQFLPDSYTAFKNKIGLTEDGEFIREKKEVVLSWPYKDCVLEGGMTKEDQKRDEIFWNQTLAPDEISRLLDPKVFTNAKRVDKKGKHKFHEFKTDESGDPEGKQASYGASIKDNLIIKGNNLLALHSLEKRFSGKVKLIYIDPPYNTGNDSFGYNDRFNHSAWLTFMRNRLEVAWKLLSPDGSIYAQIDFNEAHYLKVLLDSIFGRDRFVNEIIWRYGKMASSTKKFLANHDAIFLFTKSENYTFNKQSIKLPEKVKKLARTVKDGKLVNLKDEKGNLVWIERDEKLVDDVWDDISPVVHASSQFLGFDSQKPERLLQRIIETSTVEEDIILDFFAGTGTTGVVAQKLKRQWILIEQLESQMTLLLKRVRSTLAGDDKGVSKEVAYKGGGDFVYMELAKWNENFVDEIKKAKFGKEFQKLWETLKEKAYLSYKIDPAVIDKNAKDFADLSLVDQKRFLLECLDQNHLYINYSEIDDKEYGVSKEDKKLNKEFYGK